MTDTTEPKRLRRAWRNCDAKMMAHNMSRAAIEFAFVDALQDIRTLQEEVCQGYVDRIKCDNQTIEGLKDIYRKADQQRNDAIRERDEARAQLAAAMVWVRIEDFDLKDGETVAIKIDETPRTTFGTYLLAHNLFVLREGTIGSKYITHVCRIKPPGEQQ